MTIKKTIPTAVLSAVIILFMSGSAMAQAPGELETRELYQGLELRSGEEGYGGTVEQAALMLENIMGASENPITSQMVDQAKALVIVPSLTESGLGAANGILVKRHSDGWSAPVFVSLKDAGDQLGSTETDIVLLFKNDESVEKILQGKTYSLDVGATPATGSGGTATETADNIDFVAFKRHEGSIAGVSLVGASLALSPAETMDYYNINPERVRGYYGNESEMLRSIIAAEEGAEIFVEEVPDSVQQLKDVLNRYVQPS